MPKKPDDDKKLKDVTGEDVVRDEDLEKVAGGYAPRLYTKETPTPACTCDPCGLSATIKTQNYNDASDPDS